MQKEELIMALSKSVKTWIIIGAIILIIVIFAGSCVNKRNTMVILQKTYQKQWAQVENQLQRRYDLIPNLVNTVKGYAKHEKEIFIQIAESRAKLAGGGSVADKVKAANVMESAISRLLMIVERYPDLKANVNFIALQDELAGTENRIAVERKRFNDAVTAYNIYIELFPNNIMAGMFNFKETELFKIGEEAKAVPKIDFNE